MLRQEMMARNGQRGKNSEETTARKERKGQRGKYGEESLCFKLEKKGQ